MARIPRKFLAGHCYHVINRGNGRATIFHRGADYDAFLRILREAGERFAMPLLAACLMPNHFHFVVRPTESADMSRWMHWVMTTQVARYRRVHGTIGRIWQGRFKSFAIQQDAHLLAVMRYVERNALRAGLVRRAEDWPYGSLCWRGDAEPAVGLTASPVPLSTEWVQRVNEPQTSAELEALRKSVNRQVPFGDAEWIQGIQKT